MCVYMLCKIWVRMNGATLVIGGSICTTGELPQITLSMTWSVPSEAISVVRIYYWVIGDELYVV